MNPTLNDFTNMISTLKIKHSTTAHQCSTVIDDDDETITTSNVGNPIHCHKNTDPGMVSRQEAWEDIVKRRSTSVGGVLPAKTRVSVRTSELATTPTVEYPVGLVQTNMDSAHLHYTMSKRCHTRLTWQSQIRVPRDIFFWKGHPQSTYNQRTSQSKLSCPTAKALRARTRAF